MSTTIEKRMYTSPHIEAIKLDNDISLQLASAPPSGPGEFGHVGSMAPEYFKNEPLGISC